MCGKISIIIPVYNREAYLKECLESVLNQSYQKWEVILIDDGSTDGTVSICEQYIKSDFRFKLILSEHGGVSAARNQGLDIAQGEFVFFLDSDDVIHPYLLENLVKGMKENGAGIGGTRIIGVEEDNWHKVQERIKRRTGSANITYQNHQETLHAMFCTESPLSEIGGVMIRKDLIADTRFREDLYIGEDFYFTYQNLIKGAESVFIDKRWYFCRTHQGNSSWDFGFSGFYNRFLRRQLVWESEERFGRNNYVKIQKQQAYHMFVMCTKKNEPFDEENKKIRSFMMKQKDVFFSALTYKQKLRYYLYIYFPFVTRWI